MKTQRGEEAAISSGSPTPPVWFSRFVLPPRPAFFPGSSEKAPSPLSRAQQLAIILIEAVVAAWMISLFSFFTLTRSISQALFPSKVSFFSLPVRVLLFCNRRVFSVGQVKRSIAQFSARELVSSMIQ